MAEPRGGDAAPAHLPGALTDVNDAIDARAHLPDDQLAVWVRLVREGVTASEATLITTGIFLI